MPTKGLPGPACSKIRRQLADLPTSCKVCYNYVDACVNCIRLSLAIDSVFDGRRRKGLWKVTRYREPTERNV